MTTFIGFNTQQQYKNQTLTDFELIKRDILNALNIRQGEKVGQPRIGTTIWGFVFEQQNPTTANLIREEIERVVNSDPRVTVRDIRIYPQDNAIIIELQLQVTAGIGLQQLNLRFDESSSAATYV